MVKFDREYFSDNLVVAGVDEVGRGPLAGDVVVAAVVMDYEKIDHGVNDSKKLSKKKREMLYDEILKSAVEIKIERCGPERIDKINILEATKECMRFAIESLETKTSKILVDYVKLENPNVVPIVKGDEKSYAIACASIVAKVTRDREMELLAETYKGYAFETNMGYGTKKHIEGIEKHGLTPIHRRSFTKKFNKT